MINNGDRKQKTGDKMQTLTVIADNKTVIASDSVAISLFNALWLTDCHVALVRSSQARLAMTAGVAMAKCLSASSALNSAVSAVK